MASIVVDSELMTNYVSAVPAPAGSHHVTVLDENRMPMLFCMSSDRQPRLRVSKSTERNQNNMKLSDQAAVCKDVNGHSDMIDIHDALGLPADAELEAFHLEQSWSLKLFLCVAYKSTSSSSQLLVAKPFSPETLKLLFPKDVCNVIVDLDYNLHARRFIRRSKRQSGCGKSQLKPEERQL